MNLRTAPFDGDIEAILCLGLPERYKPLQVVASTSRGTRLIAHDLQSGKNVFIKFARNGRTIAREAVVLRRLDSAPVAWLLDQGVCKSGAYLALTFIAGETLEQHLRANGGRLNVADMRHLLIALTKSLEVIHDKGVLHLDLKPSNIILPTQHLPVIIDFEAASIITESPKGDSSALLSDGYAAPEQYGADGSVGPWTDVYALGAIGWRMLTGTPPPSPSVRSQLREDVLLPHLAIGADLRQALLSALAADQLARPRTVIVWRAMFDSPTCPRLENQPSHAADNVHFSDSEHRLAVAATAALDEGPPTVRVEREAKPPELLPLPRNEASLKTSKSVWRGLGARTGRYGAAVAFGVFLLLVSGTYGRVFFERYMKKEWHVDAEGHGDTVSIAAALARARDGSTIYVKGGIYRESLRLDRTVSLVAADADNRPVIAPDADPCVLMSGSEASMRSFEVKAGKAGTEKSMHGCVIIEGGTIKVENSIITGAEAPAILVRGGANATIAKNNITSAAQGLVFSAGSRGRISDNVFTNIAGPAIVVRSGASPDIQDNLIQQSGAVLFTEGAQGSFRNNLLSNGRGNGLEITLKADPQVEENRIENPSGTGVYVYDFGQGSFFENKVSSSGISGIVVGMNATPSIRNNQIMESGEHGILVLEGAGGLIVGNAIRASKRNGLVVASNSIAEIENNQLEGNGLPQLLDQRLNE